MITPDQHQLVDYAHSKNLNTSHGEVKMSSGDGVEEVAAGRCPKRTRPCTMMMWLPKPRSHNAGVKYQMYVQCMYNTRYKKSQKS